MTVTSAPAYLTKSQAAKMDPPVAMTSSIKQTRWPLIRSASRPSRTRVCSPELVMLVTGTMRGLTIVLFRGLADNHKKGLAQRPGDFMDQSYAFRLYGYQHVKF